MANGEPPDYYHQFGGVFPGYPIVTTPAPSSPVKGPLLDHERVSIHVDKTTHKIRFSDEDERFVTVNIEPNE